MKKWIPWLCFLLVLALPDLFAGKKAVIVSVTISGPDEHTLVIPPDYPEYTLDYSCDGKYRLVPEEEEEEEENPEYEEKYLWSAGGCEIVGSSDAPTVSVKFREQDVENASVTCIYSVICKSGSGEGCSQSASKTIYMPVWDSGTPISEYLEGTTITPNSRRTIPVDSTLAVAVSLSSDSEQDRRSSATVTTPWDFIVHSEGSSSGGDGYIPSRGDAGGDAGGDTGDISTSGSPYWVAQAGSFPEGNQGSSTTWKAPNTPQKGVVVRAMVDDLAQKPENEAGVADDAATEAGSILVDVVKPSLNKLASYVKVNDDDDDGNGRADMEDVGLWQESVNNEDDLRAAFTLVFEPAGIENGALRLYCESQGEKIRVWKMNDFGEMQPIPLPWYLSTSGFYSLQDKTLYIEGLQHSNTANDVKLEFKYLVASQS